MGAINFRKHTNNYLSLSGCDGKISELDREVYKQRMTPEAALEELERYADEKFDPWKKKKVISECMKDLNG